MACVEEVDTIPEEHILQTSETANDIILEHAYSSEDQDKKKEQNEQPETETVSQTLSAEDLLEESIASSSEPIIETQIITEPIPIEEAKELNPKPEQVLEKVKSRELKSLLDAVKESNLDTNIAYKRRSIEPNSNKDKEKEKEQDAGGKRAMRSQNPEFVAKHKKFLNKVNKGDLSSDGAIQDSEAQNVKSDKDSASLPKTPKRKKENVDDDSIGGTSVEDVKKSRKSLKVEPLNINMKDDKDGFCWRCHRDGILVQCETCPRGYHTRCLKQPVYNPDRWPCPECLAILQAESTKTRSPAMRDMSLEHLCELLKYAAMRMINCQGSEPFIHPVDVKAFPDYQNYVVQPMDLTTLQNNIRNNLYGSTVAFLADAKWILHNSIIYNSYQSKLTTAAKSIVKICKQEMSEIETCSECYQNANTKKNSWFVEVCSKPHILLWAKLKGFPYWPAKGMQTNSAGLVDVRFFGAHDRAWIPIKECFLYSKKDPNTTNKNKRNNIAECIKEVDIHIEKLKQKFEEFCHAPYRTPYDPNTELQQLTFMLPKYVPNAKPSPKSIKSEKTENDEEEDLKPLKKSKTPKRSKSRPRSRASSISNRSRASSEARSCFGDDTDTLTPSSKTSINSDDNKGKFSQEFEKYMEGYGTEDDDTIALDIKARKKIISYDSESDDESSLKNSSAGTEEFKNGTADHDDDEKSENLSESSILSRGKVRTRGGYHNVTGKVKVLGSRKRRSTCSSPILESATKLARRNSDMSIKSDSSRLSDKIKQVEEFSDTLEFSLRNTSKDSSISFSDSSSPEKKIRAEYVSTVDKVDLGKMKPVIQVNTGDLYTKNKELSISPQSKTVRIADKLMKKITKTDLSNEAEKIESVKKQILSTLESSTSNDIEEDVNNSEDVSSTDNSDVKKPNEVINEEKLNKETKINAFSLDFCDKNEEKNQNVSSSTEPSSSKEDTSVKEKGKTEEKISDESKKSDSDETKTVDSDETKKVNSAESKLSDNEKKELTEDKVSDSSEKLLKTNMSDSKTEESIPNTNIPENSYLHLPTVEKEQQLLVEQSKDTEQLTQEKIIPSIGDAQKDPDYTPEEEPMETDSEKEEESSEEDDESEEEEPPPKTPKVDDKLKKTVKLVNVSDILSGKISSTSTEKPIQEPSINKEKTKPVTSTNIITESIDIKSEPESEEEENAESDLMNNKPVYDVTLTVVDKQKKPKPEVPSPTETNKADFKIVDNMTRIIDSVASNYSKEFDKTSQPKPSPIINRKEITLKPISKLIMSPKQKARKSFPNSPHKMQQSYPPVKKINSDKKEVAKPTIVPNKTVTTSQIARPQNTVTTATTTAVTSVVASTTSKENVVFLTTQSNSVLNNINLLPPNQPLTLSQNIGSPILAMVHSAMNTPSLIIQQNPSLSTSSQIPTSSNSTPTQGTNSISNCITTNSLFPQPQSSEQISQSIINESGALPESISKAVGDLLCKPPPRLKPRPPGPLSNYYEEGSPSSAGPTTNLINSVSHRLTDYFRGVLKETLLDLASIGDPESKIRSLEIELETLKQKHAEEMLELRKNISSILKDIQKSIVEERAKIIDETRAACEAERLRCVEEAKSKQWCAFCFKEAQFYCCWNTSYCDYPCQQKHWATHMKTCSQTSVRNMPPATTAATTSSSNDKPPINSLVKAKQTYPNPNQKTVLKSTRMIVKQTSKQGVPMYVPVQQRMGGNQQTITLVESTPGNFEIVGNHGPISLGGKLVPTTTIKMKPGNILTVASTAATNNTSTTGSGTQKTIILSSKSQQLPNKPVGENKT